MIEVITRQRRRLWLAVAAAVLATALSDVGRAADSGTVNADVTVAAAAACIQLSDSSVSFGTLPLGAVSQPATPAITVTNCATTSGTLSRTAPTRRTRRLRGRSMRRRPRARGSSGRTSITST